MAGPPGSEATAVARRARPRRRGPVVLLLALALVFAGRGLGWFGGGGVAPVTDTGHTAPPEPRAVATAPARPEGEAPGAAPGVAPPVASVAADPTGASAVDADRFASLWSLVSVRQERGELGGALAVLQRTAALPLDAAQQQQVRAAADRVRAAIGIACDEIHQAVAAGQVLAAAARCRSLLLDGDEQVVPPLAARLGLPGTALAALPERDARPWPIAVPPGRDRQLRAHLADEVVAGRVVDARSEQVTLRVETAHGVTFPTVAVVACEPVEPTADEAVEASLAALQAGDALLARLWLCCARSRAALDAPRAQRLVEILR